MQPHISSDDPDTATCYPPRAATARPPLQRGEY